ncbi:hypothetical protein C8J56DRAFT_921575 [Mycena floridula]|nr:hypothetical protein C8J56DRAFT_921575 [Mycena floridula]
MSSSENPVVVSPQQQERFAFEIIRGSSPSSRAQYNALNPDKPCTECVQRGIPCIVDIAAKRLRCESCGQYRGNRRCSRVVDERQWRVSKKMGLSPDSFRQLLSLYQEARTEQSSRLVQTVVSSSANSTGSFPGHFDRTLSPMSNIEDRDSSPEPQFHRRRTSSSPMRLTSTSSPLPPRVRTKPTSAEKIRALRKELAAKRERARKMREDVEEANEHVDALKDHVDGLDNHKITQLTQLFLLDQKATRICHDITSKKIAIEQGLLEFRHLPQLLEKDLQWRMHQFPAIDLELETMSLEAISRVVELESWK